MNQVKEQMESEVERCRNIRAYWTKAQINKLAKDTTAVLPDAKKELIGNRLYFKSSIGTITVCLDSLDSRENASIYVGRSISILKSIADQIDVEKKYYEKKTK